MSDGYDYLHTCQICGSPATAKCSASLIASASLDSLFPHGETEQGPCELPLCGSCALLHHRDGADVPVCPECDAWGGRRPVGMSIAKQAAISPCETYRWALRRIWLAGAPRLVFVGLNPSTADAQENDPTLCRLIDFARRWGYGSLSVVNLFAFRSSSPLALKKAADPIGPECDAWIRRELDHAEVDAVLVGWGVGGKLFGRSVEVRAMLARLEKARVVCLGTNGDGSPKHPLYLPTFARPVPFLASTVVPPAARDERSGGALFE